MLTEQIQALTTILRSKDLQNYTGDAFWSLVEAVVTQDPFAALGTLRDIKELVFHMPTVLFWDKMERFLFGTFRDFEDQVKMAEKFSPDSNDYADFVKRQITLINQFEDDRKVDYFSNLTRALLLGYLEDTSLYFKLSKLLQQCTAEELQYIKDRCMNFSTPNNTAMISSLYQHGLIDRDESYGHTDYILSCFAIALKQHALNYGEDTDGVPLISSFDLVTPLSLPEAITADDIEQIMQGEMLVIDGGNSRI